MVVSSEHDPDAPDRPTASSLEEPLVGPRVEESESPPGAAVDENEPGRELAGTDAAQPSSPARNDSPEHVPADTHPVADAELHPPYEPQAHARSANMLPQRERRSSGVERLLVRLIATAGIVGIGVAIAAIMVSSKSQGWVVGLVVSIVSVVLAAVLWSSRML